MNSKQIDWRQIVGYEGLYSVSRCGMIKSHLRFIRTKSKLGLWSKRSVRERILKQMVCPRGKGYLIVDLSSRHKKRNMAKVHRLAAIAFIPNPHSKPEVNHKDGNPRNNHINNLEWVTHKENMEHASRAGLLR